MSTTEAKTEPKTEGEIARLLLKQFLKEEGIQIDQNFRRRIGRVAREAGVEYGEALEFSHKITLEIFDEVAKLKTPPTEDELKGSGGAH